MSISTEQHILDFVDAHIQSIYHKNWEVYQATTSPQLTLYEHFVTPHRQEGLAFHQFMIEHGWATGGYPCHVSILEPKVQLLAGGLAAVVSYTLLLSVAKPEGISHRSINETRVLEYQNSAWQVVHVHKSPAT